MTENQKISFVLHGKAGGKNKLINRINQTFSPGFDISFYETKKARHAAELAYQALEESCDFLIAVGGDGTLNEVVNGFMRFGGKNKTATVLGVLPWGTGNDFVRSIGMNRSVEQLYDLIKSSSVHDIDAGKLTIGPEGEDQKIVYFNNVSDAGFGAEVVAEVNGVHLRKKILGGALTFFFAVLLKFFTYKHKKMRVSWDGFSWEGKVLTLVVANGQFFGSGYGIAPDAVLNDGKFQVVLGGDIRLIDYFKNFGRLRKSEKIVLDDLYYHVSDHVVVEALEGDKILVETDGEVSGSAPLRFDCMNKALPFLMPELNIN